MPLNSNWYIGTTKWTAVSIWTTVTLTNPGTIRRQTAALNTLTVGNERVFIATQSTAGTTGAAEPTWVLTKGAATTDGTVTWSECTGQAAVNGDNTNTPTWATFVVADTFSAPLGLIIKRNNGVSYQFCTTAGISGGSEPAFSDTAGVTTADGTATWTSLGVVGNYTTPYTAPHARLGNSFAATWAIAGDVHNVSNNHAETTSGTLTLTSPGTAGNPNKVYCVADTSAPPTTMATTGTINTTSTAGQSIVGFASCVGLSFNCGSTASAASLAVGGTTTASFGWYFENCTLRLNGTNAGSTLTLSTGNNTASRDSYVKLYNTKLTLGAAGQFVRFGQGTINILGGSYAATGTVPTVAFKGLTSANTNVTISGLDMTNINTTLFDISAAAAGNIQVSNCKINASAVMTTGSNPGFGGAYLRIHNCDSAATDYRFYDNNYFSVTQSETTIIRAGGATNETTGLSYNVSSGPNFSSNFFNTSSVLSDDITPEFWNDITGSQLTATIYITHSINSPTGLFNNEIWPEVEYLGSSATPISSFASGRMTDALQTPTAWPIDSTSSWGGAQTVKQALAVNFTPQLKGIVRVRIYTARPSATIYVDPRPIIMDANGNIKSSGRQWLIPGAGYISETAPSFFDIGLTGGPEG